MKKQYNQPAVLVAEVMPQMALLLSSGKKIDPRIPQGPVNQW